MYIRKFGFVLAALVLALAGCKPAAPEAKPEPAGKPSPATPPSTLPPLVARLHWLGKKRVAADTNAVQVMNVWNLPESVKLEGQTLDRLAQAPIRWLAPAVNTNQAGATNPAFASLRALANDLLQQESYWEVHQAGDEPRLTVFAVRSGAERAGFWETNLASALTGLTGQPAVPAASGQGWSLKVPAPSKLISFARTGPWVVVGIEPASTNPANAAVAEFLGRIERSQAPYAPRATNFWLETELDLARFAGVLPPEWRPTNGLPRLMLNVMGDLQTVRTLGQMTFAQPLGFELEKWNIPTNLIHDPLSSFTAIQGAGAWLATLPVWSRVLPGFAPGQFYFWAQGRMPLQNYMAIVAPDASNRVGQLTDYLLQAGNAWVSNNSLGQLERQTNAFGVAWTGIPFANPHVEFIKDGPYDLIFGGMGASATPGNPLPPELQYQVVGNPKLVAYDWEMTGQRVEAWLYASQLARLLAHKAQVPPESVSIAWVKKLEGQLGNCGTVVTRTAPAQLGLVRRSTLGLSAFELNLLTDWLESPEFPWGLTSFTAPPPQSFKPRKPPASP